jgi:hypothetical protein
MDKIINWLKKDNNFNLRLIMFFTFLIGMSIYLYSVFNYIDLLQRTPCELCEANHYVCISQLKSSFGTL